LTEVRISRKGADRVAAGHPWVFASDVTDRGSAQPGGAVRVLDPNSRVLGTAHYSSTSQICLRMLSPRAEEIGADWFLAKIQAAGAHRQAVVSGSDAYRLVHAEGDGLPGLIVDRYGEYFVVQTLDQGMDRACGWILDALPQSKGVVLRNDVPVRAKESLPLETVVARGEVPERVPVTMNGLRLEADLLHGQKTGVFLDQRENYGAAARWARGIALDCFTSTGGFALHMASRCERVEAVDSSTPALETARRNAIGNGIANVEWREANVFDLLASYSSARRKFDMIVLDPPAFAKSRGTVDGAARGYKEINLKALRLLNAGGVLVTCSCSHHVSEADLLEIVAAASLDARRTLRVLERRTQAQDHPILLTVPETHYLKGLILQAV
jgi:23S rRNA (cytosine1962-C5)-methyltransferase